MVDFSKLKSNSGKKFLDELNKNAESRAIPVMDVMSYHQLRNKDNG